MTIRRWARIFFGIGLACLCLAAVGHWLLAWNSTGVVVWSSIGAGYGLAGLIMGMLPRWWRDHCDEMFAQPAGKRYVGALWPIMVFYSLALVGSMWVIKQGITSVPLRAIVAVFPALAIVMMMWAALRYLREIDELQRRIETESIGITSLLVSALYFAGGLLEKAKVLSFDAGAAMIWVFPLLMLVYGVCKFILSRRYL